MSESAWRFQATPERKRAVTGKRGGPGGLLSITRTPSELSTLCAESAVPEGVRAGTGFRAMEVTGPLEFSAVGILASLANPLAEAARPKVDGLRGTLAGFFLVRHPKRYGLSQVPTVEDNHFTPGEGR